MPLVNAKLLEGVFTPAEKQELVRKLADAIVSIKGENFRAVTLVIVEEVKSGDWGIGGKPITSQAARQLAATGHVKGSRSNPPRARSLSRGVRLSRTRR